MTKSDAIIFWPYFCWILFNRTLMFATVKEKTVDFLIEKEQKNIFLWVVRYWISQCALCFSLAMSFLLCIITGASIEWVPLMCIIVYSIETFQKILTKRNE